MKKMTKSAQMQANGGWGAYCDECDWNNTVSAIEKPLLQIQVYLHNRTFGHNARIY